MANGRKTWIVVVVVALLTVAGALGIGALMTHDDHGHEHGPDGHTHGADGSDDHSGDDDSGDDHAGDDHAGGERRLSPATLRTLGVEFGVAQPTDWTRTMAVAAVVEAPPEVERTVRAPFGGRVETVDVRLGDSLAPGDLVAVVLRDPLPRPTLELTGALLKPDSELHETVLELRARVQELDLARTELERVERYTAELEGQDLPLIPLQRRIDLQYRVTRAEAAVEQSRMEMEKHGLDHEHIVELEAGGHLPEASGEMWRRALEHNGVWTSKAQALFEALPSAQRATPWVVATIGELAGVGLATTELAAWMADEPAAAERFLEVGVLLQRGHSLDDVQRLYHLGALEPRMRIAAPTTAQAGEGWDVRAIHVQPGARVDAGSPLVDLENPAHMLLRVEPVGREVDAVLRAKASGAELSATALVAGTGPDLTGLRVAFVASSREGDGTTAYVEADNALLDSDDGRRTWGLRSGTRYTVHVPRDSMRDVFVLPADAVAEVGPDLVVFHRDGDGPIVPIALSVAYRDDRVVVVERVPGLDLFPGDEIAVSGAFALSLALSGSDESAGHGHAH